MILFIAIASYIASYLFYSLLLLALHCYIAIIAFYYSKKILRNYFYNINIRTNYIAIAII